MEQVLPLWNGSADREVCEQMHVYSVLDGFELHKLVFFLSTTLNL